jgi:hypothetical protein
MARINFDTAKRLDITTRLGDSFELELTLKDSSGIPINLFGSATDGTNTYKFKMLIQKVTTVTQTFAQVNHLYQGASTITVTLTDDDATTTADTSDASYVASTAATGKVKFSLSAEDMQGGALQLIPGYMYDIQYVDPATQTPPGGADTEKTILYGSFNFIKDVSITF